MPMVFGFLRHVPRGWRPNRPGKPDIGLPGEEEDMTPEWGIPEGEGPEIEPPRPPWGGGLPGLPPDFELPPLPKPPPGFFPPQRPEDGWKPVLPPGFVPPAGGGIGRPPERPGPAPGEPEGPEIQPPRPPVGGIWPPAMPPGVSGKYVAVLLFLGPGGPSWHYVVVDADATHTWIAEAREFLRRWLGRPPARPTPGG